MHIYLGIFAVLSLLGLSVPDRKATPFLILSGVFLLWFMGGRYYVGCDFASYLARFENTLTELSYKQTVLAPEAGFQFLIASVKALGLPYVWLNVCASLILLICMLFFCRAHRSPLMVLALLFPIVIVQLGMSGLRQALAVGFLMAASVPFMQGNRVWTGVLILVGAQFHASVIIFLPMAFLAGRPISAPRILAALMVLSPVAAYLLADRLEVYSERYIDEVSGAISSGGGRIRFVLMLIPALFFMRFHARVRAKFPHVYGLLKLFVLITLSLIPVAVLSSIALHRLNYFVMPFSILTYVYLSFAIFPASERTIGRLLPVLIFGSYSIAWFLTSRHADICYLPYQNYSLAPV